VTGYLVGRGIADITGEPAECGLLGYGMSYQVSDGIHTRLRSRAFVIVDAETDDRVLIVVNDLPLMFDGVRREVLRRLAAAFGADYTATNTMLTVTHTHCGPGGYSEYALYNSNTHGFRPQTFNAIVDGIVEAVGRAHADLAPATLTLSRGELHDASSNRSPTAFARNPAADRAAFPQAIDPQTTLLRVERDGRLVGAINWFATHGTSMTNRNNLISGDNKGYAAYHWERLGEGVDYLDGAAPALITAFAQTNTGDMSPNLNHRPGSGPTEDEFENTRIIGRRQADAAAGLAADAGIAVDGGLDARLIHVDLGSIVVAPEFTPDGREHRTGPPVGGVAAFAGTDEGPGPLYPRVKQGRNPILDALSRTVIYRLRPELGAAHAPKAVGVAARFANRIVPMIQERYPVQLLRIGPLHLIGIPGEATIVSGLRLRRTVAAIVGAQLPDVLVAGYSNGYFHYVTTPEEYDEQRYEGGSTMFGRWQLPALQQVVAELAGAMAAGRPVDAGPPPPDLSARRRSKRRAAVDEPVPGHDFGAVIGAPAPSTAPGSSVRATFAGAYPNNDLHRGGTYLEVQHESGGEWRTIADDGDWATKLRWQREGERASRITITWDVPTGTPAGRYRISYHGDARDESGLITPFTGRTDPFEISAGP
jgi:neutral ceramidase